MGFSSPLFWEHYFDSNHAGSCSLWSGSSILSKVDPEVEFDRKAAIYHLTIDKMLLNNLFKVLCRLFSVPTLHTSSLPMECSNTMSLEGYGDMVMSSYQMSLVPEDLFRQLPEGRNITSLLLCCKISSEDRTVYKILSKKIQVRKSIKY